jgi:putative transcriptional regulator
MKTRMKEYRSRLNLTQEKLAELTGVRRETIIFLEQGKYNPSLKLAHNVAGALGAAIEDIFIFDDIFDDDRIGK